MTIDSDTPPTFLENTVVDRALIERLYANYLLTTQARVFALNLLYPHRNWARWAAYFLLAIGMSLILSGIIYFFAFNWTKLTTLIKFSAIEATIILCLTLAYLYTLNSLFGKVFLTAASVLIGVFLAVFGQIYQTGADVYQLFAVWTVLISIWVFIANFAALWMIWIVILQIAIGLYWQQEIDASYEWENLIYPILASVNLTFLVAREYGYVHGWSWLQSQWTRSLLTLLSLFFLTIFPMLTIFDFIHANQMNSIAFIFCVMGYLAFFYYYRYKQPDLSVLSSTLITLCLLLETYIFKIFVKNMDLLLFLFLMSVFSLIIFGTAVIILRKIAQAMESEHV